MYSIGFVVRKTYTINVGIELSSDSFKDWSLIINYATGEGGGGHRGGSHQVKEDGGQGDPHGGPARHRFGPIATF